MRLLLVAESHVAELPRDNVAVVQAAAWTKRRLPTSFVRLVYCLGYGEDGLCSPHPARNAGTWQFWDLLGQVALGRGNLQPRKNVSTLDARLRWKVKVLETLARRGIWLEDASPIAIYGSGGRRLVSGGTYRQVVRQGYDQHVWPGVRTDNPASVWVIGRTTGEALAGLPRIDASQVISQPQDRDQRRVREGIVKLCAAAARLAPG